ncbi:hypothetical protein UFOVP221_24 [uncultured Caudovirales phage]|uniref:Uncharacterized protein n=1 Tax=uncultured Caudovirales phage TaxID=2100421 RepID=A0A6J7WQR2_9CAUD|nr:hypothetical protein UFOVP221_24 [uncultured Caudovirales phage]
MATTDVGYAPDDEITTTMRTITQVSREAFTAGVTSERERIIAMLETECECDHDYRCTYHFVITAIKKVADK